MLNPERMSKAEKQFIRTYVAALRRDFNLLTSVMEFMHPDRLAITSAAKATEMAVELQHMHAEFEMTLHNLPSTGKFLRKTVATGPSLDDLADLFTLSFFKVFTVLENDKAGGQKKDAGWFSGKPAEWYELFKQLDAVEHQSSKTQSPVFNMFSKFFPQLSLFKNFHLAKPHDNLSLNEWPAEYPDYSPPKNQKKLEYDDEYDDDENDDD